MEIKKYLEVYKLFIIEFEEAMREHYNFQGDFSDHLYKSFESEGSIENYKYRFHGKSCEIIKNNVICDYHFTPYYKNYKYHYSTWQLHVFIKTCFALDISENDLTKEIEKFVDKGEIEKLVIDNKIYDNYYIK